MPKKRDCVGGSFALIQTSVALRLVAHSFAMIAQMRPGTSPGCRGMIPTHTRREL